MADRHGKRYRTMPEADNPISPVEIIPPRRILTDAMHQNATKYNTVTLSMDLPVRPRTGGRTWMSILPFDILRQTPLRHDQAGLARSWRLFLMVKLSMSNSLHIVRASLASGTIAIFISFPTPCGRGTCVTDTGVNVFAIFSPRLGGLVGGEGTLLASPSGRGAGGEGSAPLARLPLGTMSGTMSGTMYPWS